MRKGVLIKYRRRYEMSHDVKELIEGLNEDLAGEYSAIIMYNHNAATVSGIYRQVLKP